MEYSEHEDRTSQQYYFRPPGYPPGLKAILLVSGGVFLLQLLLRSAPISLEAIFGVSPQLLFGYGFVWQLVTYAFLHDPGNFFHILFNMYVLFIFGREIEALWGTRRFVVFYLGAAAFAGTLFALLDALFNGMSGRPIHPCIGASGAVMAVMMAYGIMWPRRVILFMFVFPMRIRTFIILTVLLEALGVIDLRDNVAHSAHLGGLLFGWVAMRHGEQLRLLLSSLWRSKPRDTEAEQRRVDAILEKIHRQGIQSLSRSEQRFLHKFSKMR